MMADAGNGNRKRLGPAAITSIILGSVTLGLGVVTVWQTSHYQTQNSIEARIDKLSDKIDSLKWDFSSLKQKVEDHVEGKKP
jgi:cell division protein FtsL